MWSKKDNKDEKEDIMVTPDSIGASIGAWVDSGLFTSMLKYLSYIFYSVVILGGMWFVYFILQYFVLGYKVTYPILHYSGRTDEGRGYADILKYKADYARVIRKSGNKKLKLFWFRRFIEPFTDDIIKPGRRVLLAKVNEDGTWEKMPPLTFQSDAHFETLTPTENYWVINQIKENAQTYSNPDVVNRMRNWMIFTIVLCFLMAGFTVYVSIKGGYKVAGALEGLGPSLKNLATSLGGAP